MFVALNIVIAIHMRYMNSVVSLVRSTLCLICWLENGAISLYGLCSDSRSICSISWLSSHKCNYMEIRLSVYEDYGPYDWNLFTYLELHQGDNGLWTLHYNEHYQIECMKHIGKKAIVLRCSHSRFLIISSRYKIWVKTTRIHFRVGCDSFCRIHLFVIINRDEFGFHLQVYFSSCRQRCVLIEVNPTKSYWWCKLSLVHNNERKLDLVTGYRKCN